MTLQTPRTRLCETANASQVSLAPSSTSTPSSPSSREDLVETSDTYSRVLFHLDARTRVIDSADSPFWVLQRERSNAKGWAGNSFCHKRLVLIDVCEHSVSGGRKKLPEKIKRILMALPAEHARPE
jgi:hypothetical protein